MKIFIDVTTVAESTALSRNENLRSEPPGLNMNRSGNQKLDTVLCLHA